MNKNLWLWCKGDFIVSLARNHQHKYLYTSGVKCTMRLAAFLKGKAPLNNQSLQLRGTNCEETFVKPKKTNKTSCLTIKHATIDSA